MTPNARRALRARQLAVKSAVDKLKNNPRFPAAQVQILASSNSLRSGLTPDQQLWATAARLEVVIRQLDIRAAAYLDLVEDMPSQEAFITVLEELGRQAWEEYIGFPPEVVTPIPGEKQVDTIRLRLAHWIGEGYKRLIPQPTTSSGSGTSDADSADALSAQRANEHAKRSTAKIDELQSWPARNSRNNQENKLRVDIGVIAVREDEYAAVLGRLPDYQLTKFKHRTYAIGNVSRNDGESCRVALLRAIEPGPNAGQDAARDIIEDLNPQWLALVGIAGGVPDSEFSLGDVVVATRLHDFTVSALIEDTAPQFANLGGPMSREIQDVIASIPALNLGQWNTAAQVGLECPRVDLTPDRFYGSNEWKHKVLDSLSVRFGPNAKRGVPTVSARSIASSGSLIKDTVTIQLWKSTARDLQAVEMELSGVYAAARRMQREYPILAIRGISDIIGFKREADWTEYACNTAAALFYALVRALPNGVPGGPAMSRQPTIASQHSIESTVGDANDYAPDPFEISIANHSSEKNIGLVIAVENRLTRNLQGFSLLVTEARSFDSTASRLRDGFGFEKRILRTQGTLLASDKTPDSWFIRICGDHLEVGDKNATGILKWPVGDTNEEQIWVLDLLARAKPDILRNYQVRIVWRRQSHQLSWESTQTDAARA